MKRTFQIIKDITTPTDSEQKTVTERLKEGYAKVSGIFVVPETASTSLDGVEVSLKIAQQEVLPIGFDLSLLTHTQYISMKDATLDIADEGIPARSSELELTVSKSGAEKKFSLYVVLQKE